MEVGNQSEFTGDLVLDVLYDIHTASIQYKIYTASANVISR